MDRARRNRMVLVERESERLPGGSRVRRYRLARLERMERVAELNPVRAERPPAAGPDPGRSAP